MAALSFCEARGYHLLFKQKRHKGEPRRFKCGELCGVELRMKSDSPMFKMYARVKCIQLPLRP